MARRNVYFNPKVKSEQNMYENIIIESLSIYGQEVFYLPREWQNKDSILGDDPVSHFDRSYQMMMYVENTEGFEGEGDLFAKFGVEIRDEATFVVARRSWLKEMGRETDVSFYRPREGDLIYLDLSGRLFEIMKVEDEAPFYQVSNLPTFKMRCQLFENNGEDFDTGLTELDEKLEIATNYKINLTVTVDSADTFTQGEEFEIIRDSDAGSYIKGEIFDYDAINGVLQIIHVGNTDGDYDMPAIGDIVTGLTSGTIGTVTAVDEEESTPGTSQNDDFETEGNDFIDFSESNPFGDI